MPPHTFKLAMLLIVLLAFAPSVSAKKFDIVEYVKSLEPLTIKRTSLACPLPVIGSVCPEENVFWYFKCCGETSDQCCSNLQDWVVAMMFLLVLCTILSIIINCVRWVCWD